MSKKGKLTRNLISLIFIAYGIDSVVRVLLELADLDLGSAIAVAISSVVGVLMFVLGLMGLLKAKIEACRVIAVIVCILSAAAFLMGLWVFRSKRRCSYKHFSLGYILIAPN